MLHIVLSLFYANHLCRSLLWCYEEVAILLGVEGWVLVRGEKCVHVEGVGDLL